MRESRPVFASDFGWKESRLQKGRKTEYFGVTELFYISTVVVVTQLYASIITHRTAYHKG